MTPLLFTLAFATALYVRRRLHRIDMAAMPVARNLEASDKHHAALYLRMKRAGRVM